MWNNLPKSIKEIKTFNLFRQKNKNAFSPQARKLEIHCTNEELLHK